MIERGGHEAPVRARFRGFGGCLAKIEGELDLQRRMVSAMPRLKLGRRGSRSGGE